MLEDFYELMIKGALAANGDSLVFQPEEFITGTGSDKDDRMPHAGNPIQLIQFMFYGHRKAREYIAQRGAPWPPLGLENLPRLLNEK